MKCPICEELKLESTIRGGNSCWKTAVYYPLSFDSKGKEHNHDKNIVTYAYECSNHHVWNEEFEGKTCWCGWNKTPKKNIVILKK